MKLSLQTPLQRGAIIWWAREDPAELRQPIVGIEQRISKTATRQIILCDRGVRSFRYRGRRLVDASTPLPGPGADCDIQVVRAMLRHYFARPDFANDSSLPPLPAAEIAGLQSVRDIVELLQRHWPPVQTRSPDGLTHRQLDAEMEHFAHGALELDNASKAF